MKVPGGFHYSHQDQTEKMDDIKIFERSLLGSLLVSPKQFFEIENHLKPEYFTEPKHEHIYRVMVEQYSQREKIDINILSSEVSKTFQTTVEELRTLFIQEGVTASVYEYLARIKENHKKNLLRSVFETGLMALDEEDSDSVIAEADSGLTEILNEQDTKKTGHISEHILGTLDNIQKAKDNEGLIGIDTGFADQNARTGGWHKGDLVILGARPGMGKTTKAINWLNSAARQEPVVIYSLEMSEEQLLMIQLSIETGIDVEDLRNGNISDNDYKHIVKTSEEIAKLPIFLYQMCGINEIITKTRFLKRKYNIGFVVVDYLQLVEPSQKGGSRNDQVSSISRALKTMSMKSDCDVVTICLSQLSRSVETRGGDKRPLLSDLRDSGAIEQDADLIYFLYRPGYYDIESEHGQNVSELILAKNRHGGLGTFLRDYRNRRFTQFEGTFRQVTPNLDPFSEPVPF